jgi:hypothetical protein
MFGSMKKSIIFDISNHNQKPNKMANYISKMNKVKTITELENLINSGSGLIWFSQIFQCGFKIVYIDRTTYKSNFIKCRFESGQQATIKFADIYSI